VLMAEANVNDEQGRLLSIITRESRRLSDTLNQFLYQARPSPAGSGPVDLGPLLQEAVSLLQNGPEVSSQHEVRFECDDGPHVCVADRDQLVQVFWNLARNGLEAMPGGGVLLVRLRRQADEVLLTIGDQGRGFPSGDANRMFEPFQTGTRMGTGLGLAIVYKIVRDHHGDITVRSTRDKGTEVEVRLPLVRTLGTTAEGVRG
jgi:signal transduction histidine kinase